MSQGNLPGGTLAVPEPVLTHLPIDQTKESNRPGHDVASVPFWKATRRIRETGTIEATRDPAHSMFDQIPGVTSRLSTFDVSMDVRRGFEDVPNLGRHSSHGAEPERAPRAGHDPLQSMEASPNYVRPTIRTTPGPWDEALLRR